MTFPLGMLIPDHQILCWGTQGSKCCLCFVPGTVWGAGGQVLPWPQQQSSRRGGCFMRLFEPCLWHQLASAHFQGIFIECKEILYREIKWSDVLHSQLKHGFSTELTKSCAVWWIAMIHEMWQVSLAITLEILGLLVWNKRKEYKSIYCRVFQQKSQ